MPNFSLSGCLDVELLSKGLTLFWGGGGQVPPFFLSHISSSWVERSLHAKFQLPRLPGSGSSMVLDKKAKQNSVELEASLAPAEAEVGAEAKADQKLITKIVDTMFQLQRPRAAQALFSDQNSVLRIRLDLSGVLHCSLNRKI
jgi:hypothetical protein